MMTMRMDAKPTALPVLAENVPAELKEREQWLAWSWRWNGNKWDKPPLSVATGNKCDATAPSSWCSFDRALAAHQQGRFDGVGYAFSPDDPFYGIDLDDCLRNGKLLHQQQCIVKVADSYTEISPSTEGVKIFGKDKPPRTFVDHEQGFEVYGWGRYFCVTGHHFEGTPKDLRPPGIWLPDLLDYMFSTRRKEYRNHPTLSDRELAIDALNGLNPRRADGYWDYWIPVGMILHSVDRDLFQEWDAWSQKSDKYKPGDCDPKWKSFGRSGYTLGSLIYWAKEDGWTPPWIRNGETTEKTRKPILQTREEMLEYVNRHLIGQFGGAVVVARVEKVGAIRGRYDLITKEGHRIRLGTIKQLRSVAAVQEAIADQSVTRVWIPQNRNQWPCVANYINQLAEVKQTGSLTDQVIEWIWAYLAQCSSFANWDEGNPEVGTKEWKWKKYRDFRQSYAAGALWGPERVLCLSFAQFYSFAKHKDFQLRADDLKAALVELGFEDKALTARWEDSQVKRCAYQSRANFEVGS